MVAVNKMDLVGYDEAVFAALDAELRVLANDIERHYGPRSVHVIPLSALTGANVVARAPEGEADPMPWQHGPTLLALLESLPRSLRDGPSAPLRYPVQGIVRPSGEGIDPAHHDFRGYAGRIEAGTLTVGQNVTVLPAGRATRVSGITLDGRALVTAEAPASVLVELADDLDVARGDWIVAGPLPAVTREITAHLCWLGEAGLVPRTRAWLKHGTRTVKAIVESIDERLDIHTLAAGGESATSRAQRHRSRAHPSGAAAAGRAVPVVAHRRQLRADRRGDARHRRRRPGRRLAHSGSGRIGGAVASRAAPRGPCAR